MLRIRNWSKFQHYKGRRPPWIKLHRTTLDDVSFLRLPLASKALAPMLWLLASEFDDGVIALSNEDIAFRLHITDVEFEEAVKPLVEKGFVDDASTMLAPCKQDAIPETEEETEEETEKEGEEDAPAEAGDDDGDGLPKKKFADSEYAFDNGKGVRLTHEDYERWVKAFPHVPVLAVVEANANFAKGKGNWFIVLGNMLGKKEEEAVRAMNMAKIPKPKRDPNLMQVIPS